MLPKLLHIDNPDSKDRRSLCGKTGVEVLLPSAIMPNEKICARCRTLATNKGLL